MDKKQEIEEKDEVIEYYKQYMVASTKTRIKVDILLDSSKAAEYLQIIAETMKGEQL